MHVRFVILSAAAVATVCVVSIGCGGGSGSGSTGTTGTGGSTATTTGGTGGSGGGSTTTTTTTSGTGGAACGADPKLPEEVLADLSDPAMGMFTMDQALVGLPEGPGSLRAIYTIDVDTGDAMTPKVETMKITCELRPDKAPLGVANFVGLARGLRPWKDPATTKWVKRRFYDGLIFHRVIPGFMAQGGDPLGTGYGGPGYKFAGEITDLSHIPGTLAYANPGSNSNGSQFYITETKQTGLDGSYVIFGLCNDVESLATVKALTNVDTSQAAATKDKPLVDQVIKSVIITRCPP